MDSHDKLKEYESRMRAIEQQLNERHMEELCRENTERLRKELQREEQIRREEEELRRLREMREEERRRYEELREYRYRLQAMQSYGGYARERADERAKEDRAKEEREREERAKEERAREERAEAERRELLEKERELSVRRTAEEREQAARLALEEREQAVRRTAEERQKVFEDKLALLQRQVKLQEEENRRLKEQMQTISSAPKQQEPAQAYQPPKIYIRQEVTSPGAQPLQTVQQPQAQPIVQSAVYPQAGYNGYANPVVGAVQTAAPVYQGSAQQPVYMTVPVNAGGKKKHVEYVYEDEEDYPRRRRREPPQPVVQPIIITQPAPQPVPQPAPQQYVQPIVQQPYLQPQYVQPVIQQPYVQPVLVPQQAAVQQPYVQQPSVVQQTPVYGQPQPAPQTTVTVATTGVVQADDGLPVDYGSKYRYNGIYDKTNYK